MFRLGTLLFIPGYVTVALYRVLAGPETGGSLIVMIRECHCSFTEFVLLTSPPSLLKALTIST